MHLPIKVYHFVFLLPGPTIELIEQEVVPDEQGSYSRHRVKPATSAISPSSVGYSYNHLLQ